jgi:hypothetical protein
VGSRGASAAGLPGLLTLQGKHLKTRKRQLSYHDTRTSCRLIARGGDIFSSANPPAWISIPMVQRWVPPRSQAAAPGITLPVAAR